eukprot:COSAG03_NODE_7699_length_882_cov_2.717752_1_plen_134_part_00
MHVHVGAGRSRLQSSVEAMHGGSCAGAHFKFALLLALAPGARGQHQDCAFAPFYQPEELPAIHQLDMTIPQEVFDSLIQHSTDRSYRLRASPPRLRNRRRSGRLDGGEDEVTAQVCRHLSTSPALPLVGSLHA